MPFYDIHTCALGQILSTDLVGISELGKAPGVDGLGIVFMINHITRNDGDGSSFDELPALAAGTRAACAHGHSVPFTNSFMYVGIFGTWCWPTLVTNALTRLACHAV